VFLIVKEDGGGGGKKKKKKKRKKKKKGKEELEFNKEGIEMQWDYKIMRGSGFMRWIRSNLVEPWVI
jgi:hypothetical protein